MNNQELTVRSATMDLLRSLRINTIFGNPGSTELPLFRNFPSDFRYILGLQESIAIAMADGYAQTQRNAAFVNLHSAVGLGHALGNLFTAYRNQTPLIVTAGQQARSILPFDPFLFAERATEFPQPYIKWACEPSRARDVPAAIARAYYVAMQPPRGPAFVSIPIDDWDEPCEQITRRKVSTSIQGDAEDLDRLAVALSDATRPAFVLGAGVARDDAWNEIIALAERHEATIWTAPFAARNSFPESHRLFAGFLPAMREQIVARLAPHDLIIVIGGPLSLYHVAGSGPHLPPNSNVFVLTDNPTIAAWAPAASAIVTSAKPAIVRLLEAPVTVNRQPGAPGAARIPVERLDGSELNDSYLFQQINTLRPKQSVIVEEAPSSRGAMHDRLPIDLKDGFYTCASGGLGHGLPAAIGVALGRPQHKVIALLGDGSAMYAIQGLWSAAQLNLPISFIIVKNSRYEALQAFGRLFQLTQTPGIELPGLDFCALAQGHGIEAVRVTSSRHLDEHLSRSFSAQRPSLLEVVVC